MRELTAKIDSIGFSDNSFITSVFKVISTKMEKPALFARPVASESYDLRIHLDFGQRLSFWPYPLPERLVGVDLPPRLPETFRHNSQ